VVAAEDIDAHSLAVVKQVCGDAFETPPASGNLYGELSRRIRAELDKQLQGPIGAAAGAGASSSQGGSGGHGWNVVVGRSFGAYVTHKIKSYAYLSVFPGVNILVWKAQ
jgi:hypothetical protein